ncbi:MAG: MBL fold metallo-hydrolase [Clostridiales bacterium]|nr:MBL fold metallo-hydrolase [Clostridiales bacterium]
MNKQKTKQCVVITIVMTVLALCCLFSPLINPWIARVFCEQFKMVSKENLLVHFISVGQGDAIAVNLPDGKVMLIDTGPEESNVTYTNYLKENVLNTATDNEIDYLVLTHADMDHVGGTLRLLQNFKINRLFIPKISSNKPSYQEILNFIDKNYEYEYIEEEIVLKNNGYKITMFEGFDYDKTNQSSQVIKLEYKSKSFLFTGDIDDDAELAYIEEYGDKLNVDVLKVAHHGASTSTSEEFLSTVTPDYAVISVGAGNIYNHPTDETLRKLEKVDTEILRTDEKGNIMFVVGDDLGLNVLTGRFMITNLTFDYRYLILVIDAVLFIQLIVIILKKDKTKKRISKSLE